jgi:uncharacterized lipoprotein YmbA
MKTLLTLLFLLLSTGCATKSYYTLGDNLTVESTNTYQENIAVLKITVPKYLEEFKLVRQTSPYNVEIIDNANWLTPMQKRLTDVLIDYLQQSMNNPNVHLYPWDSSNKDKKRVSVRIKKFIAYGSSVILKANYKIHDLETNTIKSKRFETTTKTDGSLDGMMASMEKAYLELATTIKNDIIKER